MAFLSVTLAARIVLIYLQTSLHGFRLLLHSKNSQHQSPSVDNYCIYTIQYSLFNYCWMTAAEHFPQSHYLHRSKKLEVQKYTVPTYLDCCNLVSELQLSVSLSVTLDIQKIIDLYYVCVLTLILLKKNYFLNVVMS